MFGKVFIEKKNDAVESKQPKNENLKKNSISYIFYSQLIKYSNIFMLQKKHPTQSINGEKNQQPTP